MGPETICRLCDESNDQMLNVFEKNCMGIQIINVIKDCLPIVIYRTDPLSKYICNSCNETLNMFYELKKTSVDLAKKNYEDLQQSQENVPKVNLYLSVVKDQENNEQKNHLDEIMTEDASTMTDYESFPKISDDTSMMSANSGPMDNGSVSDSDMELDDIPNESVIHEKVNGPTLEPPIEEKRKTKRPIGPKSMTRPYLHVDMVKTSTYEPLMLEECVVHSLNKQNIPDFSEVPYKTIETIEEVPHYFCSYCEERFGSETKLAVHEMETHIQLNVEKVDDEEKVWSNNSQDSVFRNNWLKSLRNKLEQQDETSMESSEVDVEETSVDDNSLLVPMEEKEADFDTSRNCKIQLISRHAHVNGVPLREVPKVERYELYPSVIFQGQRRKFCNLCRYTFKDNWNIETHYLTFSCYYTCNYCGIRYVKHRDNIHAHIQEHVERGDEKCDQVFVANSKGGTLPRVVPASTLSPFLNTGHPRHRNRIAAIQQRQMIIDQEKATHMVRLRKPPEPLTTVDTATNQAYFCKKCYQVFAKLGEFNTHKVTCNGEVTDPEMKVIRHYTKKDGSSPSFCTKVKSYPNAQTTMTRAAMRPILPKPPMNNGPNNMQGILPAIKIKKEPKDEETIVSNTGRPLRHCVKEVGTYREERGLGLELEEAQTMFVQQKRPQCYICKVFFPSIGARNSHMRVHKNGYVSAAKRRLESPDNSVQPAKRYKQQSHEPIVEIHEGASKRMPTAIGAVSITPLPKKGSATMNPAIMRLVQNNPNITIKPREGSSSAAAAASSTPKRATESPPPPQLADGVRSFKCSSCSKLFANKSNLYFHKKNKCNGSRYPCPFCKKRFGEESEYSAHIFYSHPD